MAQTDYTALIRQADALVRGVPHLIANLSNLSALLYASLEDINWVGFYISEGDTLTLGPFQGKIACVEIPYGKGVCGTSALTDTTQLVPDVHLFSGHIACDSASRSELVIPLHCNGKVIGVLDIDSPTVSRFTEEDRIGLKKLTALLEEILFL